MPFNESLPTGAPKEIDLCEIIRGTFPYVFPARFNGTSSKAKLITKLKISGMKSGFALITRSTSKRESKEYIQTCHLYCQHGTLFHHRKKKNIRITKSKWCVGENNQCEFRIIITLKKDCGRCVLKTILKLIRKFIKVT